MDAEAALAWVDSLVLTKTGERLSVLQRTILQQVWQGRKYLEIAEDRGYTEGHIKDIGSQLWKLLSKELGEKITKISYRTAIERYLHSSDRKTLPSIQPKSNNFIGRSEAIAHLTTLIENGSKAIVIQGEGGLGKTTLAQQYLHQGFEVVLELLMAKETQNITSAERVVEEWLKQDLQQESGVEFGVNLARLKKQLQTRKIGILIDNLEPALDRQGQFISQHRSYVELLRVLTDSLQAVVLITSRDRLCEPSINIEHYRLPSLTQESWQQFFSSRGTAIDIVTLQKMHAAYGGNAKAMGILCGTIQADFAGDAIAYWQENQEDLLAPTDLKNLVSSQVNRLQSIDPQAYRLFCRLGCYRCQDVPKVPIQGVLALLWDVPVSEQKQVIASLRNRSLLECDRGEYYLHPVIRAEVIAQLRISNEWVSVNRQAAEFWTNSIQTIETVKDGLQALEAYYHYIAVADFELAAKVILKSRNNQWRQYLPLGSTLYRLGLLQPVLAAITGVIDKIECDRYRSEMYNILGDLYWISGKIHQAIDCQEKAIALATQALNFLNSLDSKHTIYCLKMIEIDSLLSVGLYKIDLWELDAAADLFQRVITLTQNTSHYRWAEKSTVCLALINSYLGFSQEAYLLAEPIYQIILTAEIPEYTGRFAYFMQLLSQTYTNLGEFDKAGKMYKRALYFAQESCYTQVQAKTLNTLAEINRQQELLTVALDSHLKAIDLLEKIGAKCDLAEAYFQLGLTYKKLNKQDESIANFSRAIQLFTIMEAPKQVEKVLTEKSCQA